MDAVTGATPLADKPTGKAEASKRKRSKIQFPYNPLNDGVEIAKPILQNGGQQGTIDQVAGWSKHKTSNSGTFKLKLYAARLFGLIEMNDDTISLTELGNDILDPQKERQARARAFLNVPLYRKIYEKYKGKILPSDAGLEAEIATLGVAPKQKERARRMFEHSAQQAGLFSLGRDRLILLRGMAERKTEEAQSLEEQHSPSSREKATRLWGTLSASWPDAAKLHPLIRGLLETLPPPEAEWPNEKRQHWLKTAEHIFGLIYKGNGEISDK